MQFASRIPSRLCTDASETNSWRLPVTRIQVQLDRELSDASRPALFSTAQSADLDISFSLRESTRKDYRQ
jgi:hypothetical protein